jgi:hypothetical protein
MLEFRFPWTKDRHVAASRLITKHAPGYRRAAVLWAAFIIVTGISLVILQSVTGYLMFLAIMAVIVSWHSLQPWWSARQVAKEDPCSGGDIIHIYSDDGISVRTHLASVTMSWKHIPQAVETSTFFLIYCSRRVAYYLPQDVVPLSDRAALRGLLRQQLGERAHVGPQGDAAA